MYDGLRVMVAWWMYSVCPVVLSCCRDNRPLTPKAFNVLDSLQVNP